MEETPGKSVNRFRNNAVRYLCAGIGVGSSAIFLGAQTLRQLSATPDDTLVWGILLGFTLALGMVCAMLIGRSKNAELCHREALNAQLIEAFNKSRNSSNENDNTTS